jgi:hypothetical protein
MSQYTFREKENRPGVVYDETDKQRTFVEDVKIIEQYINELEQRITDLENA